MKGYSREDKFILGTTDHTNVQWLLRNDNNTLTQITTYIIDFKGSYGKIIADYTAISY